MPNEPIQGLPYPAATVIPDVPTDIKALADAIAGRLVMRFASKAERDSVLTAPVDGMVCVTLDYGILWRRNSALGKWVVINVPTLASTVIRDAQINDPVVGTRVVIGQRTASTDTLWEYLHDGYRWDIITAPWTALTIQPGFTGAGFPAVRVDGGLVNFRGTITGTFAANVSTTCATVPANFCPPSNDGRNQKPCTSAGGMMMPYAAVWADGSLVGNPAGAGGSWGLLIGGLSGYRLIP